jgi:glucuronate isomerase
MRSFLDENFLLYNPTSQRLYFEFAESCPIYDYHCHLPPADIAANRVFENLTQIWLAGDHYKWRAMRANGVPEKYITGDASDYGKFLAYARTVPRLLRNPLYHWTHLELRRYFGIQELLNEESASGIWARANEQLSELSTQRIFEKFKVSVICTTDDPVDNLSDHKALGQRVGGTRVYPAFRPDTGLRIEDVSGFNTWVNRLEQITGAACNDFRGFCSALSDRHQFFHSFGGRLSDHGLPFCYSAECDESEAAAIYSRARAAQRPSPQECLKYQSYCLKFFGQLDAGAGWTKQLHLGAVRNANRRRLQQFGPDTGYDSIGDWPQVEGLARYLDELESSGQLPKMVLYNVNPADNYVFASLIGSFQDGVIPGKMQFGSGWWFLDQKEGMEWQLNALSNTGLLSRFVGMLTDSRSFMSYPRHEYFRRLLCNLIGQEVERGEIPWDEQLLGELIRGVCFENAEAYFELGGHKASGD